MKVEISTGLFKGENRPLLKLSLSEGELELMARGASLSCPISGNLDNHVLVLTSYATTATEPRPAGTEAQAPGGAEIDRRPPDGSANPTPT